MSISTTESLAMAIFLVSAAKAVWDFWISSYLYRKDIRRDPPPPPNDAVRWRRQRDSQINKLSFLALIVLSISLFSIQAKTHDVSRGEIYELKARIDRLESQLGTTDGGKPHVE